MLLFSWWVTEEKYVLQVFLVKKNSTAQKQKYVSLSQEKNVSVWKDIITYKLYSVKEFVMIKAFWQQGFSSFKYSMFNRTVQTKKDKTHRRQCKMPSTKKLTCKGTLRQVFIYLRPKSHTTLPFTLNTWIQYTYLHREGGEGGRVEPERRGEGQQGRVQITKLVWIYQHD